MVEQLSAKAYSQYLAIQDLVRQWHDPENANLRLKLSLYDEARPDIADTVEPLYTGVKDNEVTPQRFFDEPIKRILRNYGGSLAVSEIKKKMPFYIILTSADWRPWNKTEPKWINNMQFQRKRMCDIYRTLRSDSPRGVWELLQ